MKQLSFTVFCLVCFGILLLNGCGLGVVSPAARTGGLPGEELDPFSLDDEFAQITSRKQNTSSAATDETGTSDRPSVQPDAKPVAGSESENRTVENRTDVITSRGKYRIQIDIFEEKERADTVADLTRTKTDLKVRVAFEVPFYRVFAGDFQSKDEAENHAKILREKGFKDSRVVWKHNND